MRTYMVGYDLNKPAQNYPDLINALKQYPNWWHHLDSTWILKTNDSAATIRANLKQYIDGNDELLVAALNGEAAWSGFNDEGSNWLKTNIQPT
jgi:uncharacterized membrane protein